MDKPSSAVTNRDGSKPHSQGINNELKTNSPINVDMGGTAYRNPTYSVEKEFGAAKDSYETISDDVIMTKSNQEGWVDNTVYELSGPAPSEYAEIETST